MGQVEHVNHKQFVGMLYFSLVRESDCKLNSVPLKHIFLLMIHMFHLIHFNAVLDFKPAVVNLYSVWKEVCWNFKCGFGGMYSLCFLAIAICSLSTLTHAMLLARRLYQQGVLHVRFLRVVMACVFDPLLPAWCLFPCFLSHTVFRPHSFFSFVFYLFIFRIILLFSLLLASWGILRVEVLCQSHLNFGSII